MFDPKFFQSVVSTVHGSIELGSSIKFPNVPDHRNHVYNVSIDAQAHELCHTNVMGADKAKIPGSWIEVFIISERILSEHDTNKPKMGPFCLMYQLHLLRCQSTSPRELISGGCGCWASRRISGGLAPFHIFKTTFLV